MTITLLAPDGVPVTAQQERQAKAAHHGGGSGRRLGGRSGFRVDTPANVLTATSTTWTLGPCAAMIDPGMTTHQGMYGWSTDANVTGAMEPADSGNPRKDVLFIQVNDDTAGDGSGLVSANVMYLAGIPSATPTAPYADGFLVGTINVPALGGGSPTVQLNPARYVAAGAPLPVSDQTERDSIPDKYKGLTVQRLDLPGLPNESWDGSVWVGGTRHAEFTGPVVTTTGSAPRTVGALTADVGNTFNNDFCTGGADGVITITKAGYYSVDLLVLPAAAPGPSTAFITTAGVVQAVGYGGSFGRTEFMCSASNLYYPAGAGFVAQCVTTNGVQVGSRLRITKLP